MAKYTVQLRGMVLDGLLIPGTVTSYLYLDDTVTLAQAVAALGVWAAAVDGTIDGAFEQVLATITPSLPGGLKAATGATWAASRMMQTGVIDFSATGTTRRYGQSLPSLASSAVVAGQLNMADANIAALIALLTNPTDLFVNPTNQALEAALDGSLSFRKYPLLGLTSQRV
jgi:hypothetical protein